MPPPAPAHAMDDDEKYAAAASSPAAAAPASSSGAAPAPGQARMIIQKMVLHNFKSYAGTKEIGPFHKNFSSVVGPNGSGKSNVIDSLLFVLGRRANQIRLKKLSELIHASAAFPKGTLKECRVDIHFAEIVDDPVDAYAYTVVPNSSFVVSRIATDESKSTYKIDNRTVPGEAVQSLLKGKGMDLDNNRFLILQGEVEQIAMMKPKAPSPHEIGILEYLEDLIGTNQYVKPIEDLSAKVDSCSEQRTEVLQRVKHAEKEKDALQAPRDEALQFQARAHELNFVRATQAQLARHQLRGDNVAVQKRRAELDAAKAANDAAIAAKTSESQRLEKDFTRKQSERDEVAAAMAKSKADFAAFERKDTLNREKQKHKKGALKKASAKVTKAQTAAQELQEKMQADVVNQPKVARKVEKLRAELEEAQSKLAEMHASLVESTEPFKIEIEAQQRLLMPLQSECNACQQQLDVCVREIDLYRTKLTQAEGKYDEVRAQIAKNVPELDRLGEEVKALKKKIAEESKRGQAVGEELQACTDAESNGLKRRTQLLGLVEESKAAAASSGASQNRVLTALKEAKKRGLLPGLFDRLGNLGSIDPKYDVAITTGVGALNHILVDSTATGTKAMHFLKTNNVGRAAFIALDKQNFPAERLAKASNTPEGVPRLFDLIDIREARFAPALYFACRETLVADNMEQATRIAFGGSSTGGGAPPKRWRVVTLDGKLIEPAGTMSGGGAEVRRGGMMLKGSASARAAAAKDTAEGESAEGKVDLKAAEAELAKLEGNLAALKQRRKELEADAKKSAMALRELESACARAESEGKELATATSELRARATSLEKSLRLSPAELAALKELESAQAGHQAALSQAKKATKAITDKIAVLQQKIMERGGQALADQTARAERLDAEVHTLQEELNRMAVLAETGAAKGAKLAREIAEAQREVSDLESSLAKLSAEFTQLEEDALAVHQAFKAAEAELAKAEEALDAIQAQFEEVKSELNKLRSLDVDLEEKRLQFAKEMREHLAKYAGWDRKIATLVRAINKELLARKNGSEDGEDVAVATAATTVVGGEEKEEKEGEEPAAAASKKRGGRAGKGRGAAADDAAGLDLSGEDAAAAAVAEADFEGSYQLLSAEELDALDRRSLDREQTLLEEQLAALKPNPQAILAYAKKEKEYNARVAVLDAVTLERDAARRGLDELKARRLGEFMAGFGLISTRLKEMYQMLTLGGDAELELVDSLDPFAEGVVFSVRPPKKSWKNISNLSGGEKTLSSLALVFALHHFKPTPLYVMDEIDAALDFKNVSIVANYIKERTRNAQFIIISLRNNMFELADRLVGIYKTSNVTQSITIDPRLFVQPGQQQLDQGQAATPAAAATRAQAITA